MSIFEHCGGVCAPIAGSPSLGEPARGLGTHMKKSPEAGSNPLCISGIFKAGVNGAGRNTWLWSGRRPLRLLVGLQFAWSEARDTAKLVKPQSSQ